MEKCKEFSVQGALPYRHLHSLPAPIYLLNHAKERPIEQDLLGRALRFAARKPSECTELIVRANNVADEIKARSKKRAMEKYDVM